MMSRPIIGVMGGGKAALDEMESARLLGRRIAENGWILLNGGRNSGIMAASAEGASTAGGLTIGILPDDHAGNASPHINIPIITGMGNARNVINILSSHVIVACSGGPGTISEIALALKTGRPVILFSPASALADALEKIKPSTARLYTETRIEGIIERIQALLETREA